MLLPNQHSGYYIYIHIPFCKQKCSYCYFNSFIVSGGSSIINKYLSYLQKELEIKIGKKIKPLDTDVVYIGGGTPNYLSCDQLEKLFLILKKYINLSKVKEFTIEINPASCNQAQLKLFKKYGVTRLSFGIQTLNKKILNHINRHFIEDPSDIIIMARRMGFEVNLDFIIGLPNQNNRDVCDSLKLVRKIRPSSSFWCELRVGTKKMMQEKRIIPTHEYVIKTHKVIGNNLKKQGYHKVLPEYFSLKNELPLYLSNWWISSSSFGLGLSAFSKINNILIKNFDNMNEYQKHLDENKIPIHYLYKLNVEEKAFIHIFSNLREGKADINYINRKYGVDLEKELLPQIIKLQKDKFLTYKDKNIKYTRKGFVISSQVSMSLLSKRMYLGSLMDSAFNYRGNSPDVRSFFKRNFIFQDNIFSPLSKESFGMFNTMD